MVGAWIYMYMKVSVTKALEIQMFWTSGWLDKKS